MAPKLYVFPLFDILSECIQSLKALSKMCNIELKYLVLRSNAFVITSMN